MALTKDKLAKIRVDLNAALAEVAKKHGLARLTAGNCTFEQTGAFTWKVEGLAEGGLTKEQSRYDEGRWLGLPARGSSFVANGKTHTTWGLSKTGAKVITECSDGQKYNWPLDAIKQKFPKPDAGEVQRVHG